MKTASRFVVLLIGLIVAPSHAKWQGLGCLPGFEGAISDLAVTSEGKLYAVGNFARVAGIDCERIAVWDGTAWQPVKDVHQINRLIDFNCIATDINEGLIIGGSFTGVDSSISRNIISLTNTGWQAMDSGLWYIRAVLIGNLIGPTIDGTVNAISIDQKGTIYAAGTFGRDSSSWGLARWNGKAWEQLGSGLPIHTIVDHVVIDARGQVYISFLSNVPDNSGRMTGRISRWDGTTWQYLCGEEGWVGSEITALALDTGGILYAATNRDSATADIRRYTGTAWETASGNINGKVSALAFDSRNRLHAGGSFSLIGATEVNNYGVLTASTWSSPIHPDLGKVSTIIFDHKGTGYLAQGEEYFSNIYRFDSSGWKLLMEPGNGISGDVEHLAIDSKGTIYAGGISQGGAQRIDGEIGAWNGSTWSSLGTGFKGILEALTIGNDDKIYAAGTGNTVVSWDGTQWKSLGRGFDYSTSTLQTGASGAIYLSNTENGSDGIFAWNGTDWKKELSGIYAIKMIKDFDQNVYALGYSTASDGIPQNYVWKRTADGWKDICQFQTDDLYRTFAVHKDTVVIGGRFSTFDGKQISNIALWNGSSWEQAAPASPWKGQVNTVTVDADGVFYYSSSLTGNKTVPASVVTGFKRDAWYQLDGLINGSVNSMMVTKKNHLYIGGTFTSAGETSAQGIAWYALPPSIALSAARTSVYKSSSPVMIGVRAGRPCLTFFEPMLAQVHLFDLSGRVAYSERRQFDTGLHTIAQNDILINGTYVVQITIGKKTLTRRILTCITTE